MRLWYCVFQFYFRRLQSTITILTHAHTPWLHPHRHHHAHQVASLDITNAEAVAAAVRSVDVVVNCAVTRYRFLVCPQYKTKPRPSLFHYFIIFLFMSECSTTLLILNCHSDCVSAIPSHRYHPCQAWRVNCYGTFYAVSAAQACGHSRFVNTGPMFAVVGPGYEDYDCRITEHVPPHPGG